ncbi:MAG TPA: hypothetical protein VFL13_11000 [Candidatus Baltobacteraceae bacterium]|nr:hypothetical protein [Candidatus Baltobacteraceae bacterium]
METLRTLVVTPSRAVSPGELIRVEFAFSNLGGAPATGVRVRFSNPSGVNYVDGSDTVDGAALEGASFVAPAGADLGELPPNAERRVACSFRVNDRVEDGIELVFQAALVTDQTPVVASNVERLLVRSEPQLQTQVKIAAPDRPKAGDLIAVRATIVNTGSASARDVLAFVPVPAHTKYVQRSARVAGRALLDTGDEPFDYSTDQVIAAALPPGGTVDLEYQAIVDAPLADGTQITATATISSREVGEFTVHADPVAVQSLPDFANEDTALTVFCDEFVSPGTRVPMTVRALNSGTGDAHGVSITIDLPQGITYTPGSSHVDGQPVSDEAFNANTFALGTIAANRVVDVGISGIVVIHEGDELPIGVTLRWKDAAAPSGFTERRFSRRLRMRVSSRFTRARNYLEVDRTIAQSRQDVTYTARVFNDGTAAAEDVRLRVIPGAFLEDVRISETPDEPVPYNEPFSLGVVQAHSERVFTIQARVASPVPDRTQLTLGAVLEFGSGTFDLGVANVIARSRPHVSPEGCTWVREESANLRPGQSHDITIRFTNDGADTLRGAQLELVLPPELSIERTQNARRDGSILHFGAVAAETTHEARVSVRLTRPPRRERTLTLEGTLTGRGISPVQFDPLTLVTQADPEFAQGAQLLSNPSDTIKAGERVAYELHLRNSGDGAAERLLVRAVPPNLTVYIPGSTQLNGISISDDLGTSQLWSQRGLTLTDVNPEVELRVRWEMLVVSPVAAGTSIDMRAVVEWDGNHSLALSAPVLTVLSTPSMQAGSAGTPISVAQLVPQIKTPAPEAIVPPAEPIVEAAPERERLPEVARTAPAAVQPPPAPETLEETAEPESLPVLYVDFSAEELAQTLRAIEMSDAGGLVPHIFAIRALFPNALAGADAQTSQILQNAAIAIRAPLDRLFVRLRVPRLTITAKDLEDRDSRFALRDLVAAVLAAPAQPLIERGSSVVRLSGTVDPAALRSRYDELETAPLGSVVPWIVNAQLLGTRIEHASRSDVLGLYRNELLKVFGVLETLPMSEFHRVLSSSVNRTLDDALGAVVDALRAATPVAVD